MHLRISFPKRWRRRVAIAAACTVFAIAGARADTTVVTVTKPTKVEALSPSGEVMGTGDAPVGAQYAFVSSDARNVLVKDAGGTEYRLPLASTDYTPPAHPAGPTSTATNSPSPESAPVDAPPENPPASAAGPPAYPDDFAGVAEVNTTAGKHGAGSACVVKLPDGYQDYVVSARQLLGPAGGFDKQTAAADVPAFVKSIRIYAFKGADHSYAVTPLLINSTRLEAVGGDPIDDLALYQVKETAPQDQSVALADKLPAPGETVFLIAKVHGGVPNGQVVQTMKVVDTKTWLECDFDNDNILTAGASGAPVLDADGLCVGIYSAHSKAGPHTRAFIVPSPVIISAIKAATPPANP